MPGDLARILISQTLAEDARSRAREDRQKEIETQRELELLQKVSANPDVGYDEVMSLSPMVPGVSPHMLQSYATLADIQKKSAKRQEKLAQTLDPQVLSNLGAVSAPRPNAQGQMVAPPLDPAIQQDIAQRQSYIQQTSPELLPELQGRIALGRAAAERAGSEDIAKEKRGEQMTARTQARGAAIDRRALAVKSEAEAIADGNRGLLGQGVDNSLPAVTERLRQGGVPDAERAAKEALQQSRAIEGEIARWEQGKEGKGVDTKLAEAEFLDLQERYPDANLSYSDPRLRAKLVLRQAGQTVEDPLLGSEGTLAWLPTFNEKDAVRVTAKRQDLGEVIQTEKQLRGAYDAAVAAGVGGPFKVEGLYDLAAVAGNQPAEAAVFRNASFNMASAQLKATQGSRPSEFDLIRFMMLQPGLTEIGRPSGNAKMAQLEKMLEIQKMAPLNPAMRKQLGEFDKSLRDIPEARRMSGVIQKALGELGPDGKGSISPETLSEFAKAQDAFTTSTGAEKARGRLNKIIGGGPSSPSVQSTIDDAINRHLGP